MEGKRLWREGAGNGGKEALETGGGEYVVWVVVLLT